MLLEAGDVLLNHSTLDVSGQGLMLNPELANLASLARPLTGDSLTLYFWDYRQAASLAMPCLWLPGILIRFLRVVRQALYPWSCLPGPFKTV